MRATEFIEPEEQLKLLTKIASDARAKLERDHQAQQQLGSSGDLPLDFFKTILDVAWEEIAQWLVQPDSDAGSSPNAAGSSLSPTIDTPQPTGKKPAVARPVKSKAMSKTKPKKKGAKPKKPVKPKRVKPPPPPKPVPQPVKRVTPINPNPGQPLARIKPYGTIGLMK